MITFYFLSQNSTTRAAFVKLLPLADNDPNLNLAVVHLTLNNFFIINIRLIINKLKVYMLKLCVYLD